MSFLSEIVKIKQSIVKEKKGKLPASELKKRLDVEKRDFYRAFKERNIKKPKIIAEIKKASPSKGLLREDFNPIDIAKIYEDNGATAISVITEEKYFQGSLYFIPDIKKSVSLPILRKDFIVDEYELYEAKAYGADCILLISEVLERSQIKDYLHLCKDINLDILLEVHSERAYEKVSDLKGYLLGINNRDLETLQIDVNNALKFLKIIPQNIPIIIESGIEEKEMITKYLKEGVSGFLIGTSLITSEDIGKKLKELLDISL